MGVRICEPAIILVTTFLFDAEWRSKSLEMRRSGVGERVKSG